MVNLEKLLALRFSVLFTFLFCATCCIGQEEADTVKYEMKDTVLARELMEEGIELIKVNKFQDAINKLTLAKNICIKKKCLKTLQIL